MKKKTTNKKMPGDSLSLRVIVEYLRPEVDGGRFPIKRVVGETVDVFVDVHADGHDLLAGVLRYRRRGEKSWRETPLVLENQGLAIWRASFNAEKMGVYEYTVQAWIDYFGTWRHALEKKFEAGQDVSSELLEGSGLVEAASHRVKGRVRAWLKDKAWLLEKESDPSTRVRAALDSELSTTMAQYPDRQKATDCDRILRVTVERERARFGAWYEIFPRSCSPDPSRPGTFRDLMDRLPKIAEMGFDVVYLPPVHPIGKSFRKGPNNALTAGPDDPGSPWAIGSVEGGHKAVHPALGTMNDFNDLVRAARKHSLEIALDIAFQCSPDHPYVKEHPEWFRHRPDGSIKYAENPPKKYQDIYPLDFECKKWRLLWEEMRSVFLFWAARGVRVFRVDNPHTKSFRFWEWVIAEVQKKFPDAVFLSESFTRPPVLYYLAKSGFSQSYTYFTWRNTKQELMDYFHELTKTHVREFMRPNLFINTPDIFHEFLQKGGRGAHQIRFVLAATLGASYGIYSPPFELCENRFFPGTEDYADSEKYQIRHWDWDRPGHIHGFVTKVNKIRRENPALQRNWSLRFYPVDNDQLIAYSKSSPDGQNHLLTVVNLDPHNVQFGRVQFPAREFGLDPAKPYHVHDLVGGARFTWQGDSNFLRLDPAVSPAAIFRLEP